MWEINNSLQTICFLRALVLGVFLCLLYDFFGSLRKAGISSDFAVFIQDILFFIIASPLIFIFLLATTNGEIRLYIILGIAIGFLIFKMTVSKLLVFLLSKFFKALFFVSGFVNRGINGFFVAISKLFKSFFEKTLTFFKKSLKSFKKGLKNQE